MRQYTAGSGAGWNAAGLFEGYVDQAAYDVNVATNNNGDAIVTYIQVSNSNPATIQLWARRYSATTNSFATNPSKVFEASTIDTYVAAVGRARRRRQRHRGVRRADGDRLSGPDQPDHADDPNWPAVPTAMETDNVAKDDDTTSNIGYVTMPAVRTDPAGNVTLIWRKRTAASGKRFDLVARRLHGGRLGPAGRDRHQRQQRLLADARGERQRHLGRDLVLRHHPRRPGERLPLAATRCG